MSIPWGSEPSPDKKAKARPVFHRNCPHCTYESSADRATTADKLVARHVKKKHHGLAS